MLGYQCWPSECFLFHRRDTQDRITADTCGCGGHVADSCCCVYTFGKNKSDRFWHTRAIFAVHLLRLSRVGGCGGRSRKVKIPNAASPFVHSEMRQAGTAGERLLKTVLLAFIFFPFAVSWCSNTLDKRSALWPLTRRAAVDVRYGRRLRRQGRLLREFYFIVLLSPAGGTAPALPATCGQPSIRI